MTPGPLVERFLELALMLLVAAAALHLAVHLIAGIWVALVVILAPAGVLAGIIAWLRSRSQRW